MALNKLLFSNFLGLAPVGSNRTNVQFGEDYHFASAQGINTLSTVGVLTPGLAPGTNLDTGSASGNRITKFLASDISGVQGVYAAEEGPKVHFILGDGSSFNDVSFGFGFPVTLAAEGTHAAGTPHSSRVCADILISKFSGSELIYVSYNDSSDGDIARFDVTGGAGVDEDWFSTTTGGAVLQRNVPHPMVVGENGLFYVADRNAIHKYDDGASATTMSVIDLPADWVIYDLLPYKGYLWVLAVQERATGSVWPPSSHTDLVVRKAGVFLWNYQGRKSSEFTGFEKGTPYILDSVSRAPALFLQEGMPHVMTLGSNFRTQLRRFTGTEFQVVWEEPGDILPVRGGVTTYFNNILWTDRQTGNLYTFGRMARNLPETFNMIGSMGAASGAIVLSPAGKVWGSYGASPLVKMLDGMAVNASVTTLTKQVPKLSRVQRISVFWPPGTDTTASNTLTVTAYLNFSTTAVAQTLTATHAAGDLARGYQSWELGGELWSRCNAIRLKLDWTNSAGQATTFTPYRVEVEYEATTDKL